MANANRNMSLQEIKSIARFVNDTIKATKETPHGFFTINSRTSEYSYNLFSTRDEERTRKGNIYGYKGDYHDLFVRKWRGDENVSTACIGTLLVDHYHLVDGKAPIIFLSDYIN
jgi:hypothetical protein